MKESYNSTTPVNPSPNTPGITTTPKKGIESALHRGTLPVGFVDDQYKFLTIIVPIVHTPIIGEVES